MAKDRGDDLENFGHEGIESAMTESAWKFSHEQSWRREDAPTLYRQRFEDDGLWQQDGGGRRRHTKNNKASKLQE